MKKIVIIGGIVILLVILAAFFNNNSRQNEDGPVRIGVILPLSGDLAVIGETALTAMNIALDDINRGGGINGLSMEFVIEDSACNNVEAVKATQKLLSVDNLSIITGIICSGEALSIIPIIDKAGAFAFSLAATSPELTGVSKNFARIFASDAGQAETLAKYASENFDSVGILYEGTDYSVANKDFFEKAFSGTVFSERFVTDSRDVRTQISRLSSQGIDAIFLIVQSPVTAEVVLSQLSNLNLSLPILSEILTVSSPGIALKYASLLTGSISAQVILEEKDGIEKFRSDFKERTGKDEVSFEVYAVAIYDGIRILAEAIEEEGQNPFSVAQYVYEIENRVGLSGDITINDDGDRIGVYTLLMFDGTEFKPIN